MSILNETLKEFNYYVKKCPLYLQNNDAFLQHFKIWFDLLVNESDNCGIVNVADKILSLINIFDNNYLNKITELEGTGSDLLDKLGSIFGVSRQFSIYIRDESAVSSINLQNNADFLVLIQAQIIKNYYNGTYEEIKKYYEKLGLYVFYNTVNSGSTNVYLMIIPGLGQSYSENVQLMFRAGLLTIESMGINYNYAIQDYNRIGVWDVSNWDEGEWTL